MVISSVSEMPERAIILFYQDVIETLLNKGLLKKIIDRRSEVGLYPVYEIEYRGVNLPSETRGPRTITLSLPAK